MELEDQATAQGVEGRKGALACSRSAHHHSTLVVLERGGEGFDGA